MKSISFGNKEYVKASDIAKSFKYTQDYVGQLCRNKKVDCRLVGRVWYINAQSVTEYRKTKHATQKKEKKSASTVPVNKIKSKVESVVRPKTARAINNQLIKPHTVSTIYEPDEVAVIPVFRKDKKSGNNITIHTATTIDRSQTNLLSNSKSNETTSKGPAKIKIKVRPNSKKTTKYVAPKTPEITLQSKLKVTSVAKVDRESNNDSNNQQNTKIESAEVINGSTVEPESNKSTLADIVLKKSKVTTVASTVNQKVANDKKHTKRNNRSPLKRSMLLVLLLVVAVCCGVLINGISTVNEATQTAANTSLDFNLSY